MSFRTSQSLPYLKAIVPGNDRIPIVDLGAEDSPVVRPFVGRLVTMYVVDQAEQLAYVQQRHLAIEDLTPDELHLQALSNLVSRVSKSNVRLRPYGSIFAITLDGNFEATLMLLDEFWRTLEPHIGKELLAVAPTRDVLAIGPLGPSVESELRGVVERVRGGDHPLNEDLYHRSEGAWRIARPHLGKC